MSTPLDTSAYVAAQTAFETAAEEESKTRSAMATAQDHVTRLGPLPPSAVLKPSQIEDRAHLYATLARATTAHDAAVEDLTAKTTARDAAWASLIAAA